MLSGFGPVSAFWLLAVLAVGSALMVVVARNLLHAVLWLILHFVAVAGLFLLMTAEFLAMAQVLVYVGAVGVLVLFAVMLTPSPWSENTEGRLGGVAVLLGGCLAAVLIFVAARTPWAQVTAGGFASTAQAIGRALIGRWALPFEIASVLLVVAMIGSIVLARGED